MRFLLNKIRQDGEPAEDNTDIGAQVCETCSCDLQFSMPGPIACPIYFLCHPALPLTNTTLSVHTK